jgi:hypothetical protein
MKRILLTTILCFASQAQADGLTQMGLDDPEVIAPASDWTGPYVGLSYGRTDVTRSVTTMREEIIKGYDFREATCTRVSNTHLGNKCKIDETLWNSLGIDPTNNPWDKAPFKLNDGAETGEIAKYLSGYHGLWLGDTTGSHTWNIGSYEPDTESLNNSQGQDAILSVERKFKADEVNTITETVNQSMSMDDIGGFVGYRHDFGSLVGGVELGVLGELVTLEAQAGLDLGRVLPYLFVGAGEYDGDSGSVYGVGTDIKVTETLMVGVKHTIGDFGNSETKTTSLRVAIRF